MNEGPGGKVDHALMLLLAARRGELPPRDGGGTSGGGSGGDGMLQRVEALEKGMDEIKAVLKDQSGKIDKLTELVHGFGLKTSERLGTIEGRLTGIEKTLDAKAAKSDLAPIQEKVGSIDGTVRGLPGIAAMITLVISTVALSLGGAAGLAYALARYLKP